MEAVLQIDFQDRYFNPDTGRFLSEDPIGFYGGDANLYRYVINNPANLIDPKGEVVQLGLIAVAGIVGGAVGAVLGAVTSDCPRGTEGYYDDIKSGAIQGGVTGLTSAGFGRIAGFLSGGTISVALGVAEVIDSKSCSTPKDPKPKEDELKTTKETQKICSITS